MICLLFLWACLQRPSAEAQAGPPKDPSANRQADLVELVKLHPSIRLDIRYAGTNNFVGKPVYKEPRAFLQRPAATALVAAHGDWFKTCPRCAHGYGLLIHDGYRPWAVTKLFWDITPPALREFVADPASGSKHNRGAAIDLSMYDRALGTPVVMPSAYDEFSHRAYPDYRGGPPTHAVDGTYCGSGWSATTSPWSQTNGGTSITRIGKSIRFWIFRSI